MVRNVAYYQITNHLYINSDIKVIIPGAVHAIAILAIISVSSTNPGTIVYYAA